jgi:two-component system response regulator AtoC
MRSGTTDVHAPPTVLVVDDEAAFGQLLAEHLAACGFKVLQAADGRSALAKIGEAKPDALLIDLHMPGLTGLEVVEVLARERRLPPTIVMSAFGGYEVALDAIRLGAIDFLSKPFRMAEAELKLRLALAKAGKPALARPRAEEPPKLGVFHGMVGAAASMQALYRQIERVARFGSTVVIQGESGTGKELIARALHDASPRRDRPFVAVNCAAIPQMLLESELFGHVKGAFTDASMDRKGLFEEAHTGTLFLDEIVDLPLLLQVKLLRALQEGEIRRVGANKPTQIDVRVVAASAIPIRDRVRQGLFREDLFYRLAVIELVVPPLRERREDLALLVEHFVAKTNQRLGTKIRSVDPAAMARLTAYTWPGNVRELQNVVEQACVMADGDVIGANGLQLGRDQAPATGQAAQAHETLSIPHAVAETERALIRAALLQTEGNRTHAAELLGISARNLQYKIKQYDIHVAAPTGRPKS